MFRQHDSEIGIAMMQAHSIASEFEHEAVSPDHILLGFTTNLRGDAQPLLAEHGLRYAEAREVVRGRHPSDAATKPATDGNPETANLDDDREALASIGIDLDKVTAAVGESFGEDITRAWGRRRERAERGRRQERRADGVDPRAGGPRPPRPSGPGEGPRPSFPGFPGFPGGPDFPGFEGFSPWGGPRGRGRRGPQSRRFGRGPGLSESTVAIFHELRSQAHDGAHAEDRREARAQFRAAFSTERILLALLESDDPAVVALRATMTDVDGLVAALQARADAGSPAA